ncbi:MAG: hypothetical protein ACYC1A_05005 [Spirochaetales bacterium]
MKGNASSFSGVLFLFILLAVSNGSPVMAQAVRSLDRVGHIRTESFDIYYSASLADQGKRLASFADAVLADLCGFFGFAPPARKIPVLISDREIDLNGYFSPYPSNRILIFAAGAGASGQLASLSDELRSVFTHELTHFVTLTLRSPFWSGLAALSGDFLVPTAWMMPNALIEGTAVWIESRRPLDGSAEAGKAFPPPGRLNDPAALEPVYGDILQGRRRGLWDVSNAADFPGSGSLPYLYGALFADFLSERYGSESLADLWRLASKGDIFEGFDGTRTSQGLLGSYTARPPEALWDEFLDWLGRRAEKTHETRDVAIGAAAGRIGVFCADSERVYFFDAERGGVVAADIAPKRSPAPKPRFLFPADGYIEDISLSAEETGLEIDWVRSGQGGKLIPARYSYDFAKGKLLLGGDREAEGMGEAATNLGAGAPRPFLNSPRLDQASGYRYGLVRLGSRTMPGRIGPEGAMELLDSPLLFVRSLALREGRGVSSTGERQELGALSGTGPILALSATLPGGLSRIALAVESPAGWKLYLQKAAPEGGAFSPAFSGDARIVYRAEMGDGKRELRVTSIAENSLSADYECSEVSWKPLDSMRALAGLAASGQDPESKADTNNSEPSLMPKQALFPRAFAASRYPYATSEAVGLKFEGSDLTERLAWQASLGWNFAAKVPEASLGLSLSIDMERLSLAATDSTSAGAGAATATRILGAGIGYGYWHYFLPNYRRIWADVSVSAAGLQKDYAVADFLSTTFDYGSFGSSLSLGYSTMRTLPFAPFDKKGFSSTYGLDVETLPGLTSAFSFSGALSLAIPHPAAMLALYGTFSPGSDLLFHPLGRYHSVAGIAYPSALSASYPNYEEYGAMTGGSPWYCFGELSARIATIELWKAMGPVRMPSLPSWTIRRISLWTGLRAAMLDQSGSLTLPSSAFARLEFDAALLAGLAARGHIALNLEASWAFSPALAGGQSLHLTFGSGVTY